jgi:hypothetical protein
VTLYFIETLPEMTRSHLHHAEDISSTQDEMISLTNDSVSFLTNVVS